MGVLTIVACVWGVLVLVSVPLALSVLTSFFPALAPSRRTSGRIVDRGAACLIAATCALAYWMWRTRFLPYVRALDPRTTVVVAHALVAHALWLGTVINWAFACLLSPRALAPGVRGLPTTCAHCGSAQARRTEHCRTCAACIAGFDHHCPFIAQCVGAHNSGCFLRFLAFAAAGCAYATCVSFAPFFECIALPVANLSFGWRSSRPRPDAACRLVQEYALLFVPTAGMCALVALLAAWQCYLRVAGDSTANFVRRWRGRAPSSKDATARR
ncbi:hypothetical protein KFE25_008773 [Diacronema lutheri]|uniref:Palmitoyltransferase n=1 Tax=Diacronema lutheri TaxID=2081491 RepID=A0A8J5XX67_DIALT|nr:hypothetical protein KFE25_008773 [Diacronema lutheri]